MRLSRLTTRRLMAIVTVVAVALGWTIERRSRFRRIAESHASRVGTIGVGFGFDFSGVGKGQTSVETVGRDGKRISPALSEWHRSLAAKYRVAASRPWLPVAPDPPPP